MAAQYRSESGVCCYSADGCYTHWFSRPAGFGLGLRNGGHLRPLRKIHFVFCPVVSDCGWCSSDAQNSKFCAQIFDLHHSGQRSRTRKNLQCFDFPRSILEHCPWGLPVTGRVSQQERPRDIVKVLVRLRRPPVTRD